MKVEELEWQTRKRLIDPKLKGQGWRIGPFRDGVGPPDGQAVTEYPTDAGPADYALCEDSRVVGVVEAKKLSLGPQNVLTQAERYSRGLTSNPFNFHGFHVPFLYSTNGEVIWFHDVRHDVHDPVTRRNRVDEPISLADHSKASKTHEALSERLSLLLRICF